MGGHLAAYNTDFTIDAIVVSGAPIDAMSIPGSVEVVSVQHDFDPVPRPDLLTGGLLRLPSHGANWTTIQAESAAASSPVDVGNIHNVSAYSATLAAHVAEIRQQCPDLDTFFAQDGLPSSSSYYHWKE